MVLAFIIGFIVLFAAFLIKKKRLYREDTSFYKMYSDLLLFEPDMLKDAKLREEVIHGLHDKMTEDVDG